MIGRLSCEKSNHGDNTHTTSGMHTRTTFAEAQQHIKRTFWARSWTPPFPGSSSSSSSAGKSHASTAPPLRTGPRTRRPRTAASTSLLLFGRSGSLPPWTVGGWGYRAAGQKRERIGERNEKRQKNVGRRQCGVGDSKPIYTSMCICNTTCQQPCSCGRSYTRLALAFDIVVGPTMTSQQHEARTPLSHSKISSGSHKKKKTCQGVSP